MRPEKYILFVISLTLCTISCNNKKTTTNSKHFSDQKKSIILKKDSLDNILKEAQFQNEIGNHQNYSVTGTDEYGNIVKGILAIEGETGIGLINGEDDKKIEIIAEWSSSKKLIATDENGYLYKLKLNE